MQEQRNVLIATQELRRKLMGVLGDEDLGFRPAAGCVSLGELCREMGEIQHTYIESFRTFRHDFSYRHDPQAAVSIAGLTAWYAELDRRLGEALEALQEDDLARTVDRGYGFAPPVPVQFHIYREALLIFYAKAHVYLKALGKQVEGPWRWWIGDRADYENATG